MTDDVSAGSTDCLMCELARCAYLAYVAAARDREAMRRNPVPSDRLRVKFNEVLNDRVKRYAEDLATVRRHPHSGG
jgi:hypothetical protein